jgi:hypothetical protein
MSVSEIKNEIVKLTKMMNEPQSISYRSTRSDWVVTQRFLSEISNLMQYYGNYVGKAKAEHYDYKEEIDKIDGNIKSYFEHMLESPVSDYCFKLTGLMINKISEQISFIENIGKVNIERSISNKLYQELTKERDSLKEINEFLVKHNGLPELNKLLEQSKNIGLPTDEYWVLALCSLNLMEAIVNKKLEILGEKFDGNFKDKYNRLCDSIKKKEQKDISKIMPFALYDSIRNKLDHASNVNKVTPNEAIQINVIVNDLINQLFS